jgi:hypothetical protein
MGRFPKNAAPLFSTTFTGMDAGRYLATTNLLRDHDHDHAARMARFAMAAVVAAEVRASLI